MAYGLGIVSGNAAGTVVPLPVQANIGSDPARAEVCLPEAGVSPRHAQLLIHGELGQLVDLHSEGGTWVDGEQIPAAHPVTLALGSLIRFGEGGPLVVFDAVAALASGPGLVIAREDGPGGSWMLTGPLQVGRGSDCAIQLDPQHDVLASSRHVHLLPAFGRAVLTDLGSANGTFHDRQRVLQVGVLPGERFHLGSPTGPTFRVDAASEPAPSRAARPSGEGPIPIPEMFRLELQSGEDRAQIVVACKTEVRFGSFAGLNDWETSCFARELESEADALDRSDAIGPQHGAFALSDDGVDLVDNGDAPTKLNGTRLPPSGRVPLSTTFELWLGEDSIGFRGKLFRHPNLPPAEPRVGFEGQHPVECMALERMGDAPDSRLYVNLIRQATIGSSEDAAINICAPGVGDLHALLYLQQDALWVTQLGPHPVAVSGVPLAPGTTMPIAIGSEFFVGTVMFRVAAID